MIPFRVQGKADERTPLFPEFRQDTKGDAFLVGVGILQGGMLSGKASISMMVQGPGGTIYHVECSAEMFLTLGAAMRGAMRKWGEPWDGACNGCQRDSIDSRDDGNR